MTNRPSVVQTSEYDGLGQRIVRIVCDTTEPCEVDPIGLARNTVEYVSVTCGPQDRSQILRGRCSSLSF